MFTLPMIEFVEGVGASVGLLFSLRRKEEEMGRLKVDIARLVSVRTRELLKASERLFEDIERARLGEAGGTGQLGQLQSILEELKILKGTLPICCMCKRIRDDEGNWSDLESYIQSRSGARFSHGVCPTCYENAMAAIDD
jgi:hypothetical protein